MNFRTPHGQDPLESMGAAVYMVIAGVAMLVAWVIYIGLT